MNRDLGACERLYWVANQWSPNNVIAIGELDGTLQLELLERSVALLQRRHPLLQVRVLPDRDGGQPRFVRRGTGRLPFRSIELAEQPFDAQLDALVVAELNRTLDAEQAMARVVYAHDGRRSALIVTCLHIIADATSAMLALRDLLACYGRLAYDPAADVVPLPVRPPYEGLLPAQRRGAGALLAITHSQTAALAELARKRPARLPAQAQVPLPERRNALLRRSLPMPTVEQLKAACRQRQVTLHGLLTAALALAVGRELSLHTSAHAVLNVGCPVTLRAELEPAIGDELGSYVATLSTYIDVGRGCDVWSAARAVNQELARRRARDEHFASLHAARWAAPPSRQRSATMMELVERTGPGNVCLSNIGHFDVPPAVAGVPLRSAHWTASLSFTGYFLCAACSTSAGLALDFVYIEGAVSAERAQRIVERMLGGLAEVLPQRTAAVVEGVA